MSAKARSLRERMSIDPDAPSPVSERRPRPRAAEPAAPPPEPPPEPTPVREEPSPVVESDDPPITDTPAEAAAPAPRALATTSPAEPRPSSRRPPARRSRRPAKERIEWESALDDPAISADGNGYRSFYVSDEVFARFRAAVYWTARRPDVDGVPDNMSVGVEEYMDSVATDLERRFNDTSVFPPTPDQVRAHRKRQSKP